MVCHFIAPEFIILDADNALAAIQKLILNRWLNKHFSRWFLSQSLKVAITGTVIVVSTSFPYLLQHSEILPETALSRIS